MKTLIHTLALTTSLFLLAACGGSDSKKVSPEKIAEVNYQTYLDETISAQIPGVILRVETADKVFIGSAGFANVETQAPMQSYDQMAAGSAGKPMIALLAAMLHFEHYLDLDDTLPTWLTADLVSQIEYGEQITLRQLLNHTSGIYNYTDETTDHDIIEAVMNSPEVVRTDADIITFGLNQPAYFQPGEDFHYSNTNYVLVGLILDQVLGEHHFAELRRRILSPLAMDNTFYLGVENDLGDIIDGYQVLHESQESMKAFIENFAPANAPVASTVTDLAIFMHALISDNSFISEEIRDLFVAPESFSELAENHLYGFGLEKHIIDGKTVYAHGGGYSGYLTENYYISETQTRISAFINCYDDVCKAAMVDLIDKVLANEL